MLRVSYILSIFFLFFSFFCPVYFIYMLNFDWGLGYLGLSLVVDKVSLVFSGVVMLVVSQVYVYSSGYMKGDSSSSMFFFSLSLFITSMLLLIFAGDIITLFLAWDGLGVSSFLLVAYYSKMSSIGSGYMTIIMNRFGDAFIILGMSSFLIESQSSVLFQGCSSVFFILGAFSKSAQFPLMSWLPSAMAAPTPISSLVHSSTLVTAGVYLLMRLNFSLGDFYSTLVPLISLTYIIACIDALCSEDLKRIIAMSTLGNLSLMFVSLFLGYYMLCLFHLCNHALFKSLAFLCGGNIITTKKGSQDIGEGVEMKGVSLICLVVSLLSLMGFPFSSGFFSKDLIFDMLSMAHLSSLGSLASLVLGMIGGAYVYNIFLSVFAVDSISVEGKVLEDESSLLLVPIIALSFFCIILAPVFSLYLFPFSSEIFVLFCDKILFYSFFGIIVAMDLIEYVFSETFSGSLMFLDDSYDLVTNFGFSVSMVETKSVEYGWLEHGIFMS